MFLPVDNLKTYWNNFYNLYGNTILNLSSKWYNEESIYGSSCIQFQVNSYYLAFTLALMIKREIDKGYVSTYTYYNHKYNIDNKRCSLSCNGINLDKIFEVVNVVWDNSDMGINGMGIEVNFVIEPNYNLYTISTINIKTLLTEGNNCTSIYDNI